jgi:hypothetical protein
LVKITVDAGMTSIDDTVDVDDDISIDDTVDVDDDTSIDDTVDVDDDTF